MQQTLFLSNTAEVRPIYLKMGYIARKPAFVICEHQRRRSACAFTLLEWCTPILFPCIDVFVINRFDKKINDFVTFGTQIFEL